jgi:hypothetical protein
MQEQFQSINLDSRQGLEDLQQLRARVEQSQALLFGQTSCSVELLLILLL